ncbi:MAG: hypothetical protein ACFFBD_16180 [Candidatus Hodarchaeota archaeon]
MAELIDIIATKCTACGRKFSFQIPKSKLEETGSLSGVATVSDIHGIYDKENPHVRILYVDLHGMVRAQNVIKLLVGLDEAERQKSGVAYKEPPLI